MHYLQSKSFKSLHCRYVYDMQLSVQQLMCGSYPTFTGYFKFSASFQCKWPKKDNTFMNSITIVLRHMKQGNWYTAGVRYA